MKKLMMILALAGLMAGCAHDKNAGGTADQNEMNSGSSSSAQDSGTINSSENSNSNAVTNPDRAQP
jgi:hypothetical protein